jgi:Protein of unknown function (DUF2934)
VTEPPAQLSERRSFSPPAEPEWHRMISEAAYYLAQKRQFTTGGALDDWLRAEVAIRDSLVASSQPMDGSDEAPVRHEPR